MREMLALGKIPWRRKWQPSSSILALDMPWTEEPGGLQSTGTQRIEHDLMMEHAEDGGSQEPDVRKFEPRGVKGTGGIVQVPHGSRVHLKWVVRAMWTMSSLKVGSFQRGDSFQGWGGIREGMTPTHLEADGGEASGGRHYRETPHGGNICPGRKEASRAKPS